MFRLYQITPRLKQLKQCRNDVATLCCATNRRCESSRVGETANPQKNEIPPPLKKKKNRKLIFCPPSLGYGFTRCPPFWF